MEDSRDKEKTLCAQLSLKINASLRFCVSALNKKITAMENENNTIWAKILKIAITVLTAIATVFGIQACGIL